MAVRVLATISLSRCVNSSVARTENAPPTGERSDKRSDKSLVALKCLECLSLSFSHIQSGFVSENSPKGNNCEL